jgi:glycosyltransferase involved in cell wall biosynthesis
MFAVTSADRDTRPPPDVPDAMTALSVIVPFYNAERFVPTAIESLRVNWFDGAEFVLVEDGSNDGTRHALEGQAATLPGARIVPLERNVGLASARNAGLDAASGRYVCFYDADDWLAPGYLAQLHAAIVELDCDFVRTDHVQVTGQTRRVWRSPESRRNRPLPPRDSILPVTRPAGIDYPYSWAGVFDTTRVPPDVLRFSPGLRTAEDRPWIWRLYLNTESHAVVGLSGLFYRREVPGSLTQIGDERQLDFLDAFDIAIDAVQRDRDGDRYLPKVVRAFCGVIAHQVRTGRRFPKELRAELYRRSGAALAALPEDLVRRTLRDMADRRALLLWLLQVRYGGAAA